MAQYAQDGRMSQSGYRVAILFGIALLTPMPAALGTSPADDVTIYRCVDKTGKVTLSDSPCMAGQHQEMRAMQRPQDPPPRPTLAPPPIPPPAPDVPREVPAVTVTPPRPMYECVTPEGERYTSDSGEGNPRWQPFWIFAPSFRGGAQHPSPSRPMPPGKPQPPPVRPPSRPHPGQGLVPAGGMMVYDECHPLPQQEVCARLSDRRFEIMRRYNSALQSERRQLDLEQRGIDARMANDCPGY